MKKNIFILASTFAVASLIFVACKKKDDETIHPTYKEEATGTASNPQPNNITVTGTQTVTNPATVNSAIIAGGNGWTNPSCITTNSLYLKANNGDCEVTLSFAVPPPVGGSTYNIASAPGVNAVAITITKAPNQPAGTVWYGRSGTISVSSSTSAVSAVITGTGVTCLQSNFNFPQVTLTGVLGCN